MPDFNGKQASLFESSEREGSYVRGILLYMFLKWLSCVYHCVGHPRGQQGSPWHGSFFFSGIKALISCPFISQGHVICTRVPKTFWKNKWNSVAVPTLTGALSMVWMLMFLQSSQVESLMPHVMVWGVGPWEVPRSWGWSFHKWNQCSWKRPRRAPPTLLPREDTLRRQLSMKHQNTSIQTPWSWTSRLQSCKK